jgi:ribose transport system ATP-binding protein
VAASKVTTAQPNETVVSLREVSKSFGSVDALKRVSLDISGGEIHILLGENGAGKSTLVNVILGAVTPDSGVLEVRGRRTAHQTPAQAREQGINAVLQDFSLAPSLKVYENLFLGREVTKRGLLQKAEMRRQAMEDLAQLGVAIDVDMPVARLSRPEQQVVEIVRALGGKPGALLLDEPTATLNQEESERLFALIDRMKEHGWGLLYITHRLDEVRRLGDRVTVLRDGAVVATHSIGDVSDNQLIQEMVGRQMERLYPHIEQNPTIEALRADRLYTADGRVRDASFSVRRGEIVGIAGLVGSGKSELARACFGLVELSSGTIHIGKTAVTTPTPRQMLTLGLVYLPEDRRDEALALNRSIVENVSLEVLDQPRFRTPGGLVRDARLIETVEAIADRLDIRPRDIRQIVGALSGGNQQKVVLARAFTRERSVYVFHEPTAGVDIGARQEFYNVIKQICEGDTAVVLVSSDLPEVVHLAHRVYVMHSGQIQAELTGHEITDEAIASHSFGHGRTAH